MSVYQIKYNSKSIKLHKAIVNPNFSEKTILVRDHWNYVEMWLQKEKHTDALMYWKQAENFYQASLTISDTASPLTIYYTFLNATKTLLKMKGINFAESHGTSGEMLSGNTNLKNEIITFHRNGILSSLCNYFNESCNAEQYSLKDLLYNLPFIHRSFNLTFPSGYPEIFIPIINPHFVIKEKSNEAWLSAELSNKFGNQHTINKINSLGFERELSNDGRYIIRTKKRFRWYKSGQNKSENITELTKFHFKYRKKIQYIYGSNTLWYIKRSGQSNCIDRHPLTIMFASMHRLSELARYQPTILYRHFELKQNWLLSEFIKGSLMEFIDQIACEITGQNLMQPGVRYPN
jgi:hypothetical protein